MLKIVWYVIGTKMYKLSNTWFYYIYILCQTFHSRYLMIKFYPTNSCLSSSYSLNAEHREGYIFWKTVQVFEECKKCVMKGNWHNRVTKVSEATWSSWSFRTLLNIEQFKNSYSFVLDIHVHNRDVCKMFI